MPELKVKGDGSIFNRQLSFRLKRRPSKKILIQGKIEPSPLLPWKTGDPYAEKILELYKKSK